MRILAIDVGEKKIGLAVGDTTTRMAFVRPAFLVSSWEEVWPAVQALITNEDIDQVLVGWPMNTDGTVGVQADRVQQFVDELSQKTSVPIIKRDERNSSIAIQREQQAAGQKLTRGQEDSLAAQILLESYLMETR